MKIQTQRDSFALRIAADEDWGDWSPTQDPDLHMPTEAIRHYAPGTANWDMRDLTPGLVNDVKKNGVQRPVEIVTNGTHGSLIDGNNRLMAAHSLGITHLPVRVFHAQPGEIEDYDPPLEEHVGNWLKGNEPHGPEGY